MNPVPLRVLHVIGGLNRGGLETWLIYLLRRADRSRLEMDFLVHTEQACPYDAEALSLHARIHRLPLRPPLFYLRKLWNLLRGPVRYDVIHSHAHFYSGWVLSVAAVAGVPVRIAHSHLDTRPEDARAALRRRIYLRSMSALLQRSATAWFSCSTEAGKALFGGRWGSDPRSEIFRYGVDLRPFEVPPRSSLRSEFGIPDGAFVIGHAARFVPFKNHAFIVEIAKELCALDPRAHFLLLGDGALRPEIERRVKEAGLKNRVTLTGERSDVAAVMTGAMDAFVFPSFYEGLPVTLVEAQAAGLPCLVSDRISPETRIVEDLYQEESIDAPASTWAKRLLALRRARTAQDRQRALGRVNATVFEASSNLRALQDRYLQLLAKAGSGVGQRASRASRVQQPLGG